jgi:DNA-binding SARP family transcriptional activator
MATDGVRSIAVGGPKQRMVLAALAVSAGSSNATDRLVDLVWGDSPPPTARRTLQSYIAGLRTALGSEVVVRRNGGYPLNLDRSAVDVLASRTKSRQRSSSPT